MAENDFAYNLLHKFNSRKCFIQILLKFKAEGADIMGYCFVTTQKVKTLGALGAKYNHNYRKVRVDNADPDQIHKNEELLSLPVQDGRQMSYVDFFHKRFSELPYYQNHKFRNNQNCAIEVVTTFSREDNTESFDLKTWKEKQVSWLKEQFNRAGDGRNNIASVIFHADEPGNMVVYISTVTVDDNIAIIHRPIFCLNVNLIFAFSIGIQPEFSACNFFIIVVCLQSVDLVSKAYDRIPWCVACFALSCTVRVIRKLKANVIFKTGASGII